MTREIALVCCALILAAAPASAQSSTYLAGVGFAEIKALSGTESNYGDTEDSDLDGTTAGGGLRVGTFLHPRWSLELAIDAAAETEGGAPYYPAILADLPGLRVPEFKQSIRFLTVSTVVGYHPAVRGRLHPGYLLGISFITSTYTSQYPSYYILAADAVRATGSVSGALPTIYPPPPPTTQTFTSTQHMTGAILGFETAIAFGERVALVPEVRALAFSTNNVGGVFLIRPGVGVRWRF